MIHQKFLLLSIVLSMIMILTLLSGCQDSNGQNQGTEPSGGQSVSPQKPSDTDNQTAESDAFDMGPYYLHQRPDLEDGNYAKMEIWVEEDGVESEGWMSIEISIDGDKIQINVDGILGDTDLAVEYIDEGNPALWDGRVRYFLQDILQRNSHPAGDIFYKYLYFPMEEYFIVVESIGGSHTDFLPDGYMHSIPGYDSYTMGEGVTFLRTYEDTKLLEVCISPDQPFPLYLYAAEEWFDDYDPDANKFSVELVDFRQ